MPNTIRSLLGEAVVEMVKARAPATFAVKQIMVAMKLGKKLADVIAPGGGEGGGITLEKALVRLTKASPDLPLPAMERLQTVLSGLHRGLSLDDLVTDESTLKVTEAAPPATDLEQNSAAVSGSVSKAIPKSNRSKEEMANAFALAIARDESKREGSVGSTCSSGENVCTEDPHDTSFSASRKLATDESSSCDTVAPLEERNWLHLSAAERAEALRNVAQSAEQQADGEFAAAASRVEEKFGNHAVDDEDEDGESPKTPVDNGEEIGEIIAEDIEAKEADLDVARPKIQTLGSSLSLLEAELSGDPHFEPVREVASKVLSAVRAGRGLTDPLNESAGAGNKASSDREDTFFEELAPDSSVREALEYLVRSTQPRQARRADIALQVLMTGGGLETPL